MKKKLISLLLIIAMILTVLPMTALASDPTLEPEESAVVDPIPGTNITEEELEQILVGLFDAMELPAGSTVGSEADASVNYAYTPRTASPELIEFIKVHENVIADYYQPMWDVSQWSIGFGSRCPVGPKVNRGDNWANGDWEKYSEEDFNSEEEYEQFASYIDPGMSLEEATELLYSFVNDTFGPAVNQIAQKYNITLTQQQFDALVDFSYALGAGWGGGCRLLTGLNNNYHGQGWTTANSLSNPGWFFINGIGSWCHVSGVANHGAATRRVQELEMFQHGKYYGNYRYDQVPTGNIHYTYLIFDPNGGDLVQPAETDWSESNRFYFTGSPYGSLISASKSGSYFAGWYTDKTGGTKITADTIAKANLGSYAGLTVYAHWSSDPNVDPQIGSPTDTSFKDVAPNAWYASTVKRAVDLGLMNGVGDGNFNPQGSLTRGMVVTILYRMAGNPKTTASNPFRDVAAGRFYSNAVLWAVANGITTGTSSTTFSPNDPVTRQDLTTFLYRYAKYWGESTDYSIPSGYTDFGRISGYAAPAMCWAVTNGLINGQTSTTLAPQSTCTRAEAATIFVRYVDKFE